MVARRYEFYVQVARTIIMSEQSERVRYCSCHENIKFISLSQRVMFFSLYGEGDFILNNKRDARNQFNKSKRRDS